MSIANELITHGIAPDVLQDDEGRLCLIGAAATAYGTLLECDTLGTWDTLPDAVKLALLVATGAQPVGFTILDAEYVSAFNDGSQEDEVLRAAKIADEILDVS